MSITKKEWYKTMGYNIDWECDLTITPALNKAEIEFLNTFFENDHRHTDECYTQDGTDDVDVPSYPGVWCNLAILEGGVGFQWNGEEKTYALLDWVIWVTDQYLSENSPLKGLPQFEGFTFNHIVSGSMTWSGEDLDDSGIVYIKDGAEVYYPQAALIALTSTSEIELDKNTLKQLFQTAQIVGAPGTEKNEASKKLYSLLKFLHHSAKQGEKTVRINMV